MKCLIVEDNAQMRRVIKSVIGDLAEVCECGDGAEALAAYTAHHPDWVLMDIKLKEMNGLVATRLIKAAFPDARVLIVTNYDDAELRASAHAAGACAYIVKEDLLALRHWLG